jgi:Zn-dependent protease with chaperone function
MNFFEHQEVARRKTSLLVFYFAVATVLIVGAVYLAVAGILLGLRAKQGEPIGPQSLWNPQLILWVTLGTVSVIVLGSLYKVSQLGSGGATVAELLGGRLLNSGTQDLDERVVLNVVEEMAIASGTPVPPVYLLDEEKGINAFAAGYTPNDAVIGVTRGAAETLTRDELQGVIAHEFSHILNGDMRLNIRLMGVLHGILLIALIGYGILRSLRHVRVSSRSSKKGGGGLVVVMIALGIAFLVVGYIGVFFGKLIKSAVSRQREFLADASAVQFTRNPGGIAGALCKIGGLNAGSRVEHTEAQEASHMFFGNALRASFLGLMSTHPPLDVRIKRIDPNFDGAYPDVARVQRTARDLHREQVKGSGEQQASAIRDRGRMASTSDARAAAFAFQPDVAVGSVGAPAAEHVDYAAAVVAAIPERVNEAVHEPLGAVATVYCLLLDADPQTRSAQVQCLAEQDRRAYQEVQRLAPEIAATSRELRLPIAAMAVPALCRLSASQYRGFRQTVERLIAADEKMNLFEYALQRMLFRQLAAHFEQRRPPKVKYPALRPLLPSCAGLLSMLAHSGQRDADAAARAFAAAAKKLATDRESLDLLPPGQCGLKMFDESLTMLAASSPAIKKRVLDACAICIGADGRVTIEEEELLRVIADALDCPMPPLLASHSAV